MYAIVNIAGKQFKVTKGDKIQTATIDSKPGAKVVFDNVFFTDDGEKTTVGNPMVKNAVVTAKLVEHGRTKKILVYKKKRRKGYENKNTHRQGFSILEIQKIETKKTADKKTTAKTETKTKAKSTTKKTADKKTTAKTETKTKAKSTTKKTADKPTKPKKDE